MTQTTINPPSSAQPQATESATDQTTAQPSPAVPQRSFAPPKASSGATMRIVLFALIVLVPVIALGYVYYDFQRSGGIKELPDGYKLVDLKAMSNFPFDQENGTIDDIPEPYRNLNGQKVVLEGQMYLANSATGRVQNFDLVYSIANCCYTSEPQVQHFVASTVKDGDSVRYYRDAMVRARGTLWVDVKKSDGRVVSVYQFDVEDVEPI